MKRKDIFTPTRMNVTIYKNTKKFGDKDLDGTPNHYDCKPNDVSKDSLLGRALNIASKGRYGQTASEYSSERESKRRFRENIRKKKLSVKRKIRMSRIDERASFRTRIREAKIKARIKRIEALAPSKVKIIGKKVGKKLKKSAKFRLKKSKEKIRAAQVPVRRAQIHPTSMMGGFY